MKMKAAFYYGPGDIKIQEVERPTAGSDGVVMKVGACGICNILESDAWVRKSEGPVGFIMGHEYSGEVVEVGSNVTTVKVGDRIFGEPVYRPCYSCDACRTGDYWRCTNWIKGVTGKYGSCGALAEYFLIPFLKETSGDESFIQLPKTLSFRDLCLIEPLILSMGLAKKAKAGDVVVVLGQELVGLGTVAKLKEFGIAKVIASDISQKHLEASKGLGADVVVDELNEDVVRVVMKETFGMGADLVIVLDRRPIAFSQAINMVRMAGKIFVGTSYNLPLRIDASMPGMQDRGPRWAGPVGNIQKLPLHYDPTYVWAQTAWGTLGPKLPRFREALEIIQSGKITADKYITHVFPLEKTKEAFDVAMNPHESIKVIVEP